jgi:hypothetical protein
MWKTTFEERLAEWVALRNPIPGEDVEAYLIRVNEWWHRAPWTPYYLHWADQETWPTPWELLDDNIYCTVSRGLGIIYTLALSTHPGVISASLAEVENDNLVLVNSGLYTLNYSPETIVNIILPGTIRREVSIEQIKLQLK